MDKALFLQNILWPPLDAVIARVGTVQVYPQQIPVGIELVSVSVHEAVRDALDIWAE